MPLLTSSAPDDPTLFDGPDRTETGPLFPQRAVPENICTAPLLPTESASPVASVALPEEVDVETPVLRTKVPLTPPVARPVATYMDPVAPLPAVPELSVTVPDTPAAPPFAVRSVRSPDDVAVPKPLTTATEPPVNNELVPAATYTWLP